MEAKKEKFLDLLKLNYNRIGDESSKLALKHTLVDTNNIVLCANIFINTIVKELRGQIPEVPSIDSLVGIGLMSLPLVLPIITLSHKWEWNFKPILCYKYNGLHTYGNIRRNDNVFIINSILDGKFCLECIEILKAQRVNVIDIFSLIDPLDNGREILIQQGYQPISIYTLKDIKGE